jgi:plastocyanin
MLRVIQTPMVTVLVCCLAGVLASCSSGDDGGSGEVGSGSSATAASAAAASATGDASDAAASAGDVVANAGGVPTATIKGSVVFKGEAPVRKKINMSGNKECAAIHGDNAPLQEAVIVGANGGLANAFVWITKGLEGQTFEVPTEKVAFDQRGCKYSPHVFGLRVGQDVEIRNSDPILHNVHIFPTKSNQVNRSQTQQGNVFAQKFRRAEPKPMRIKCDVHPWMTAYAGVLDHPYFAVTGDDGTFELPKIAPGTYTVTVWHEGLDKDMVEATVTEQQVTVTDGETKALAPFEFSE